jgi:2-phosphosulfolactate phosphatase
MEILTFFAPVELTELAESAEVMIVFDVLGGSTTVTAALNGGISRVVPVSRVEEAIRLGQILGRDYALLSGEKNGLKIQGFDITCSPLEFGNGIAKGKTLVFLSDSFSEAVQKSNHSKRILLGCFNNIEAIVESIGRPDKVHLLCVGKSGKFSFEDAVCAGMFIETVLRRYGGEDGLNDASVTSRYLYGRHTHDIFQLLRDSGRGQYLAKNGRERDLKFIARTNISKMVPALSEDKTHIFSADAQAVA